MKLTKRNFALLSGSTILTVMLSMGGGKASGFDNMGIGSMDLLFDPAKYALEFGATYVNRNVDYNASNAKRSRDIVGDDFPPNVQDVTGGATNASVTPDVWNYAVNAKFDLNNNISCLARLNNPGTILEEAPEDWNGRYSIIKTELTSFGLDTTCALKYRSRGHVFSLIGGARYIEAEIGVLKYSHLLGAPSIATVNLAGTGYGWRAGIAYEFPEYAIRASLFYDHEIAIDATGTLDSSGLSLDASSNVVMPSGVEFRVQSGIAPGWLAFAGVKWVDWSSLSALSINADYDGAYLLTSERQFNFTDGWTVTAGIGHQLTDNIQVGTAITWDQGIGGSYSDTYQWGLGGAYKFNDNVTWSLGGAVIYKTAVDNELVYSVTDSEPLSTVAEDQFDLSYDASWNFALTSKLKLSF